MTLLDHVTPAMSVYTEEIFGPVLCVVRVDSYDEAVAMVNASPSGNGCAIFTRDGGAARRFQLRPSAAWSALTCPSRCRSRTTPSGAGRSLFGDTHMYGPEGVHFYTRGKVVTARWPDPATRAIDLGSPDPVTDI